MKKAEMNIRGGVLVKRLNMLNWNISNARMYLSKEYKYCFYSKYAYSNA